MSAPWTLWRSMPPRYQLSLERKEQPKPREKKGDFILEPQATNRSLSDSEDRESTLNQSLIHSDKERLFKKAHPAFPCRRSAYLHHMKVQGRVNSAKTFINEHPSVIPSRPHTRAKSAPNLLENCAANKSHDPFIPTREYTTDSRNLYYKIRHDPRFSDKVVDIPESYEPEPESTPERFPARKVPRSASRVVKKLFVSPENSMQFQYVSETPLALHKQTYHSLPDEVPGGMDGDQRNDSLPPGSPPNTEDPETPSIPPHLQPSRSGSDQIHTQGDQSNGNVVQEYMLRTDDILRYYSEKDCSICKHIADDISIYQQSLMSNDGHQRRLIENSFLTGRPLMDYLESHTPKEITNNKVHKIFLGNVRDHFSLDTIHDPLETNNAFFQLNRPSVLNPRKEMGLPRVLGKQISETETKNSRKLKPSLVPCFAKENGAVKLRLSKDNQARIPAEPKESPRKTCIKYAEIVIPSATESDSGTLLGLSPRKSDMNATI
ncbi:uncharacterized protein LOC106158720 [Lingula anatina]|uniref:Uncharacterized protein LOC106158720 n=1 Tax=Lingula anatina TaxID=7574 RepID=A0A1S3HW44_LINAN|nr:uncharacterized protein LOC106158720 [Lingula anatina]|eukprot:XP_013390255.1 uncharacterized protein LOC106158720 [Lingula anatina]